MALYPIRRPTLGLQISSHTMTLVEVRRDWRRGGHGWHLKACRRIDLPEGVIRLSSTELNLLDVQAVTHQLKGLLEGRRRCVAVSLPDHCARIALFDFDTLPQKPAEVEAILRWRFQNDLNLAVGKSRMQYRVFRTATGAAKAEKPTVRILVAAVREEIVSQYEQLCEAAGVMPVSIGLSSLALIESCRPVMTSHPAEALFLHATDDGFTFMAFRQSCPVFLRTKALPGDQTEEILATLQYYADRGNGAASAAEQAAHHALYLVKQQTWQPPAGLGDFLPLKVITLDWDSVHVTRRVSPEPLPLCGLPALAAVLAV